jgi:hypothetical protein
MEALLKLEAIFLPYATKKRNVVYENRTKDSARFVHYTSADAALKIIRSKRVWMRNTTCMSDYREVQHGYDAITKIFSTNDNLGRFQRPLDALVPGAATEAVNLFNGWWRDIRFSTYITSISEHDDKEDLHGRLSMWRAFGSGTPARVALVLKLPITAIGATEELKIMVSPVAYMQENDVQAEVDEVIENIGNSGQFLQSVDRQQVVNVVYTMLMAGVVCIKHEGFLEEREWRIVYGPKRMPSALMESSTETIGGVPQLIHSIPLDSRTSPNLADVDLARLFDRLIIGPSSYSWAMYEAFVGALTESGVTDAANRVVISGIPIRA